MLWEFSENFTPSFPRNVLNISWKFLNSFMQVSWNFFFF
jgi:hypothetical protein